MYSQSKIGIPYSFDQKTIALLVSPAKRKLAGFNRELHGCASPLREFMHYVRRVHRKMALLVGRRLWDLPFQSASQMPPDLHDVYIIIVSNGFSVLPVTFNFCPNTRMAIHPTKKDNLIIYEQSAHTFSISLYGLRWKARKTLGKI